MKRFIKLQEVAEYLDLPLTFIEEQVNNFLNCIGSDIVERVEEEPLTLIDIAEGIKLGVTCIEEEYSYDYNYWVEDNRLIGTVWKDIDNNTRQKLLAGAYYTGEGEVIVDLTDELSINGMVVSLEEENILLIDEEATIYSPIR